ncbi:hypothetical protein HYZ41_02690 [archaeon]|nr:hypothetical protein [archaeon]
MKVDIKSERYNPFLKRKELVVHIENPTEPTPRKSALQQLMAKETKKDVENIEVIDIFSNNGEPKAVAHVDIWDDKKVRNLSKPVEKEETAPVKEEKTEKKEEKKG